MASDLSGFSGYDDWAKAAGPGATKEAWYGQGGWKGTKPRGGQQQQAQQPAFSGTQEQYDVARQKAGTYADDSADAGNWQTGDAYLDELRSGQVAGSEDWRRFSNDQMKAWQNYYVGGGKFRNAYGDIVDKPDDVGPNTPPGYNGTGDYIGGGGGGRGQGGAGGGKGKKYSSGNAIFDYLSQSGLDAAKDPEAALRAYMGYGGAGQYQAQMDQARAEAEQLPPGPARDAAMARLSELKTTGLSGMRQAASAAARGDLSSMLGTEQGYAQLAENARQANMQNALGWGGLDVQKLLGLGNLDIARGGLDLQNRQFGWESGQKWSDILNQQNLDRAMQEKALKASQPSTLQKIFGGLGQGVGLAGSIMGLFGGKK